MEISHNNIPGSKPPTAFLIQNNLPVIVILSGCSDHTGNYHTATCGTSTINWYTPTVLHSVPPTVYILSRVTVVTLVIQYTVKGGVVYQHIQHAYSGLLKLTHWQEEYICTPTVHSGTVRVRVVMAYLYMVKINHTICTCFMNIQS